MMANIADSNEATTPAATDSLPVPISEVEYGFTKNLGGYQSSHLRLRSAVPPGQTWLDVYNTLTRLVHEELEPGDSEARYTQARHRELTAECARLDLKLQEAKRRYDAVKASMEKIGITLPEDVEDLPF